MKFKMIKIAFMIIFDKKFRWILGLSLKYAIESSHINRGTGASDVLMLKCLYLNKILKPNKLLKKTL